MHEINIVPYIDVMLVLLVIFMVTAPLITPAVIDLPTRRQGERAARRAARGLRQGRPGPGGARARRARRVIDERTSSRAELAEVHQERARQERGALGADRRRQERALRVGAAGDGRAAQAGRCRRSACR